MSAPRRIALPALLIRFWAGVAALTVIAILYTIAMSRLHHDPHRWGMPLLTGADFGWDLNIFRDRFLHFREPGFWQIPSLPLTYPAPAGVVIALLYRLAHPLLDYLLLCAAGVAVWMVWLIRRLTARGVSLDPAWMFTLTVAATCWPLWVLFDTANIEGFVAIVLGAGVLAFVHRRWWLSAALIGVAGSMKIFPLILLGLLLSKRRYREFFGGIAIAIAVAIASLAILGPSISEAQRQISLGLRIVTTDDALAATSPGPDTNHSLYNVVRYAVLVAHHRHPHAADADPAATAAMLRPVYSRYLVLGALAGLAAYILRIRRLPMLNQMLALTVCAVTLPPLSRDYTLIHLLVPFGLLCTYAVEARAMPTPGLPACFFCLAFIFTPDTFFNGAYSLASPIRALALLALFLIVLEHPFHTPSLDEPSPSAIV